MKTIVFGDIHGRSIWKDIVSQHSDADRFVFLGDYFTSREGISVEDQITNFGEIVFFADMENETKPGRVILLRGNHDMEALGYEWASCSPWFGSDHYRNEETRQWFLDHTQWVFVEDGIVYAHAGVTKTWMENVGLDKIEDINSMEPSRKFGFWGKFSDYYGDSKTQGPTWIRPWTLVDDSFGEYTYIVGHTTTHNVTNYMEEIIKNMPDGETLGSNNTVWTCDCLGDGRYVIVEDGKVSEGKI